jgi:hypothetical protein
MTAQPIQIDYQLAEHGWASFRLTIGDRTYDSGPVSYCTDALGDLARAALATATGALRAEASFELEPGELRLVISRQSMAGAFCLLSILEFPDFHHQPVSPDAEGALRFGIEVEDRAFAQGMLAALDAVWAEHGTDGYNALWQGRTGFPLSAMEALRRALEVTDPPPIDPAFEEMWAALIDEAAES